MLANSDRYREAGESYNGTARKTLLRTNSHLLEKFILRSLLGPRRKEREEGGEKLGANLNMHLI